MNFFLLLVFDNRLYYIIYVYIYILNLQHVQLKISKYGMLQNSNKSHHKHNIFDNIFLCLTYGNDILLEVVHDHPPKSLI
jgi:hypothetical protein